MCRSNRLNGSLIRNARKVTSRTWFAVVWTYPAERLLTPGRTTYKSVGRVAARMVVVTDGEKRLVGGAAVLSHDNARLIADKNAGT